MNSKANTCDIRFIMPKHSFSYHFIENSGYSIGAPYFGNAFALRILREVHFRLNLPFKSIWFNKKNIDTCRIIIVYENLIISGYMKWLYRKNAGSRIILFYENPVSSSVNPQLISGEWCEKWSADSYDCNRYGMKLYEGGGYFKIHKVNKKIPEYDVFYVGKDKGRLGKLQQLQKQFNDLGLNTYFHITAERRYSLKRNKYYKPSIPYEQVLDTLGKSRSILHLVDGCQTGISVRVEESLIHEIKLITDNQNLMKYDFYHPNNVFILGLDDIKNLPAFLDLPYEPVKSKFYEHMYFEDFIHELTGITIGGK